MVSRHLQLGMLAAYLLATLVLFLAPIGSPDVAARLPADPDKIAHFGLIALLAALLRWNLPERKWRGAIAVLLAGGYAVVIELLQALLPHRSGDPYDLAAGVLGAVVGVAAAGSVLRLTRRLSGSGRGVRLG
jgi:VanZ family protein